MNKNQLTTFRTVEELRESIAAIFRPPPAPRVGLITYACGCSFPTAAASVTHDYNCASCYRRDWREQ